MPDRAAALLEALAERPIAGVTCRGKTDGGGAQVQAVMSARLFAHLAGVPYFHTPFATVAHGSADAAWASAWEQYFRLGDGFDAVPDGTPVMTIDEFLDAEPVAGAQPPVIASVAFHSVADARPDAYLDLVADFRERARVPEPAVSSNGGAPADRPITAAVHVRRGDVGPAAHRRFTTNDQIARSIASIREVAPHARVVVYSQGSPDDFADLPGDVELALDTDVLETMTGLITADILVMAKSSFSYIAGVVTYGTVVYEPFWHQPLSRWVHKQEDGSIDVAALRAASGIPAPRRRLFGRR